MNQGCKRDVARRDREETETFKKNVSRRLRPGRSRHQIDTLTETFKLKVYICNFWHIIWNVEKYKTHLHIGLGLHTLGTKPEQCKL